MDFIIATGILGEKDSLIPIVNSIDDRDSKYEIITTDTSEETELFPIVMEIETFDVIEKFITSIQDVAHEDCRFIEVTAQFDDEEILDSYSRLFYGLDRCGLTVKTSIINKLKVSTIVQSLPTLLQITTELIKSTLSYPTDASNITLLVSPEGAGEAVIQHIYDQGRSVSVYASTDDTDYVFDHWSDFSGILSYNSEYQLCIPELNYFLTANFVHV